MPVSEEARTTPCSDTCRTGSRAIAPAATSIEGSLTGRSYTRARGGDGASGRSGAPRRTRRSRTSRSPASPSRSRGALARAHQGRRRSGQCRSRAPRSRPRRPDCGSRRPHRRGRVRRPVPDRRLPDRFGDELEHERERGDRDARRRRRPPERPREHGPVVERRVPVRRAPRGARASSSNDLLPALERLAESLERKAAEFDDVVKSGRTHLMDAVPVTLGQEFGGYAAQVRQGIARVQDAMPRLGQIPLGGTATGTGLNTHPEFAARVREYLAARHGPDDLRARRPLRGAGGARRRSSRPPARSRSSPSR